MKKIEITSIPIPLEFIDAPIPERLKIAFADLDDRYERIEKMGFKAEKPTIIVIGGKKYERPPK